VTIPRRPERWISTLVASISLLGVASTSCASDAYPHLSQHRPGTSQMLARAQGLEESLTGSRKILTEGDVAAFHCLVDSTPAELRSAITATADGLVIVLGS
jgi:hypothetical protein